MLLSRLLEDLMRLNVGRVGTDSEDGELMGDVNTLAVELYSVGIAPLFRGL